jgi:hypothetical protein
MLGVRRIGLAGVLALALGGATRGAAEPPPPGAGAATAGALLLRAGAPSLVLAVGARIESVDPESGKTIGALTPVTVPGFTWRRFLRRGRFLLAEGRTDWTREPFWNATRGLVLLDETGRVRWTETHILTRNRASHAVFLDGEGNVAFDKLDQPQLIKPDGTRIDTSYPPAGPVLHGKTEVLPLKLLCSTKVDHWLAVNTQSVFHAGPSDDIVKQLLVKPTPDDRQLALVQTIDVAPEEDMYRTEVKTAARMPLPPACGRGARRWVSETMSPRHWILECAPEKSEYEPMQKWAMFVIDVEARTFRRLAPPPSDQSGVPRDARLPDKIDATVMPDGTIVATVWNHCRTAVHMSTSGGGWKRSDVASDSGASLGPEAVCGRLTLRTALPGTTHCSHPSGPATHVLRPDGSWLALPYAIAAPQSGSCSGDAEAVAFIVGDALTTARLDRDERRTVRAGLNKDTPLAWLP